LAGLGQALHSLSVRWYLFGAQAAILYGAARLTADVDITADPGARSLQEIIRRLADHAFEPRVPDVDGMADSTRVLPLVHVPTRIPVDVVLAGPGLEELFFAAVRDERIDDV